MCVTLQVSETLCMLCDIFCISFSLDLGVGNLQGHGHLSAFSYLVYLGPSSKSNYGLMRILHFNRLPENHKLT